MGIKMLSAGFTATRLLTTLLLAAGFNLHADGPAAAAVATNSARPAPSKIRW